MRRKTELHIRSPVGRYLEHGRIYSFFDGVHTRIYIASGDFLTRNTECRVEVGVRVEDPVLVKKLTDILQLQLRDNVNAREMRPDDSYQKVKPAEGEPIVNGQMGMYDLLRNDWTREEPWKPATPKAAPAEAPAAEKQTAAEGPKAKTPGVPVQEPPKAKGPDFAEAAPATPAPIHLEPTEQPKGGDHFDELEQMLDKKHLPDQPQKPTVVVTAPKKRGLFSQVLDLFKRRNNTDPSGTRRSLSETARWVFLRVCPHAVNQNRGRNVPCEKERKTEKDPQPGGVLRARPFWQACVLRYRRRAARRPAGAVCFPLQTAVWRVSDGYGTRQDPLPGKSASTKEWTLPVRKARRCWLSGKELPRLPDAATAMASACSCCTRTAPRPFMRTCNTCMCVPVKRYRPGRYWARQGRPAVPPGHTCTLSCADRGPPATRRPCWDCRMHRRTPLRDGAASWNPCCCAGCCMGCCCLTPALAHRPAGSLPP